MENKQNFAGIIIPVIVAVILLTVLPIINSINEECPPCESCPSYNIGNMEVNPNFSSGDYIVDKGDYDYLDNVTIIKDENLIPENIKQGVNIFGIEGTYQESLPTGPKVFEVDDILPATTNLRISWIIYTDYIDQSILIGGIDKSVYINTYSKEIVEIKDYDDTIQYIYINNIKIFQSNLDNWQSPYTKLGGGHAYIDIDTSDWSIQDRTITLVDTEISIIFYWQDLNA